MGDRFWTLDRDRCCPVSKAGYCRNLSPFCAGDCQMDGEADDCSRRGMQTISAI